MLLVLDTCEDVVDVVSKLVGFLLTRCPQLTIIATSREVLSAPSAIARSVDALADGLALFEARVSATLESR
ncbi:MAG: hypothetical protein GY925_14030, partial [Actinomycetia bacterium]|nr:hypothetical protein [Actinomycetes bacterium]